MFGSSSLAAGEPKEPKESKDAKNVHETLQRLIPRTGELLPPIGLGTYRTFDVKSVQERAAVKEVLRLFIQQGGKLVDSSPMYGNAESVVGDLMLELGVRRALFFATKVWTSGRIAGITQMQESMQKLRTDRIDLMQVHNLLDVRTHLKTLKQWKADGKIRYIGITHYQVTAFNELAQLLREEEIDFVQLNYNMAIRDAETLVLPVAQERNTAVIVNRPFEEGEFFRKVHGHAVPPWAAEFDCKSWAQFFLKFILAHPAVTCVIPATSKPKHLLDNMEASHGRLPDAKTRQKMLEHVKQFGL